jgi:hypothetical protein
LVARLIRVVVGELKDNSRFGPRCLSISILTNLITKIDHNDRFASVEDRHRIALMFFPLILNLIQSWKEIEPWRRGWDGWCFCVVVVVSKLNRLCGGCAIGQDSSRRRDSSESISNLRKTRTCMFHHLDPQELGRVSEKKERKKDKRRC